MKKTITKMALALSIATTISTTAQTTTFETFTLSPNSYYKDLSGADFSNGASTFRYNWSGGYWESGSAYSNVNDTITPSFQNLYGCITGSALSGNNYATVQGGAVITFSNSNTKASGFYITNTTYAWKEIKKGGFGRRFGDTTGTGSGTSIPQGQYPDWFKLLVTGYRGGMLLPDTAEFYLADYRPAGTANDYVVKNWQYLNCANIGQVDSIVFVMKSSDNNAFGMKTPAFFCMDNFTTAYAVGINELTSVTNLNLYPNPTTEKINLKFVSIKETELQISIFDISGKEVLKTNIKNDIGNNTTNLQTQNLEAGIYFIKVSDENYSTQLKFIKL